LPGKPAGTCRRSSTAATPRCGLDELLPDLQEMGIAQQDSLVSVFAFAPGQTGSPSPLERTMALRLRVATTEPSHSWFTLPGRPTAIVAVSRSPVRVDAARLTDAVVDAIEHCYGERPAIGWSGSRVPVYAAAQAFRHARLALNLARIGVPGDQVTSWTELGSWQTLALLADSYSDRPDELATLVHPGIVGLIDDGRGNLLHTLDVYLAHGGDARKTADALHLHRSTLYYRLEKITEAVGGDLSDGEARFELMLGIRLAYLAGLYRHSSVIGRVGVLRQLSESGADGSDDGPMRGSGGRG
jgi:PucR-like helix-turn-helix protein